MQAIDQGRPRTNSGLLLRTLRAHRRLSRAQLATLTGLSKATVSPLIADLERRGLVRAGGTSAGGQGPGRLLELRPGAACGVGPERALDELAALTTDVPAEAPDLGGLTVAVPGLVDARAGVATFASRLRWREVAVLDGLAARTGLPLDLLGLENDANPGALAEHDAEPVADLVYLAVDHGVGAGVLSGGVPVRGAAGHAGEVGHLVLDPFGPYCSCGRRGCWETRVGLGALLHACTAPEDSVCDPNLDPDERMALLRSRAERGDGRTLDALHRTGVALGAGVSILATLLDPAVVVLGGYPAALSEWLVGPIRHEVVAHGVASGPRIVASRLGFTAGATGAALAALGRVLDDPTAIPVRSASPAAPAGSVRPAGFAVPAVSAGPAASVGSAGPAASARSAAPAASAASAWPIAPAEQETPA